MGIEIGIGGEVMALLSQRCLREWFEDVDPLVNYLKHRRSEIFLPLLNLSGGSEAVR